MKKWEQDKQEAEKKKQKENQKGMTKQIKMKPGDRPQSQN